MNLKKVITLSLVLFSASVYSEEYLVGYQFGSYHYFDTSTCDSLKIRTQSFSDAPPDFFADPYSLASIYNGAINRARRHCFIGTGKVVDVSIDFYFDSELQAQLVVRDTPTDSRRRFLFSGERISILKNERVSNLKKDGGLVKRFFDLGNTIILEQDENKRLKYHPEFKSLDLDQLLQSNQHEFVLEVARVRRPDPKDDKSNRLNLDNIDGISECPLNNDLMRKAADLGSPIAAYQLVRCITDFFSIIRGVDAVQVAGDNYPEFMFYLTKALSAKYSPAYEFKDAMRGYDAEFEKYAAMHQEKGIHYTFNEFKSSNVLSSDQGPKNKIPDFLETQHGLNTQILLENCSRMSLFSSANRNNSSGFFTALTASSIKPRYGWCATETIGARINLKIGQIESLDCQEQTNGDHKCNLTYRVDCQIDSFESTRKGNEMICRAYNSLVNPGEMLARRQQDGSLRILKFRPLGSKQWMESSFSTTGSEEDLSDKLNQLSSKQDIYSGTPLDASQKVTSQKVTSQNNSTEAKAETSSESDQIKEQPNTITSKDRKIANYQNFIAYLKHDQSCSERMEITTSHPEPNAFRQKRKQLKRLLAAVRITLKSECPQINDIVLIGESAGEVTYRGVLSKSTDWAIIDLPVVKQIEVNETPQIDQELAVKSTEESNEVSSSTDSDITECDRLTALPHDPESNTKGVKFADINAKAAISACKEAIVLQPNSPRLSFQYGRSLTKAENYSEAMQWFKQAAEQNYIAADFGMGYLYFNGFGVEKNLKTAMDHFLKAANRNLAYAQHMVGWFNEHGKEEKNYSEAFKWYRKAAEQGYVDSQLALGNMYDNGRGIGENDQEAAMWYRKAAEQDNAEAQFNLGLTYMNGNGIEKNSLEAIKWFGKAANQGSSSAQFNLGVIYLQGIGVEKNYSEANRWFLKATELGHADAQAQMGVMFLHGQGIDQNYKEAFKWMEKAALGGDVDAQRNLGEMYAKGHGVQQNDQEAVIWYRKAAKQGHARGQFYLGVMYNDGRGVSKDEIEAFRWFQKSAEQGHANAQYNLGIAYATGDGVPKDEAEAVKWLRRGAEQGHADSQVDLGFMYGTGRGVKQNNHEAVKWYRKAVEQGHARGQFNLGAMYNNGEGVSKDVNEAVRWFRKAADQGNTSAQFNLGLAYEKGHGVQKNFNEALKWYKKAAQKGQIQSLIRLGDLYDAGKSVDKSEELAFSYYLKAAEKGDKESQDKVASSYARGLVVEKNIQESLRWYEKTVEQGNYHAAFRLADVYFQNIENSEELTLKYYQIWVKKYVKSERMMKSLKEHAEKFGYQAYMMGIIYEYGLTGVKDIQKAMDYYKFASKSWSVAEFKLGFIYLKGEYVEQDYAIAFDYLKNADDFVNAQYLLGTMYENGYGTKKDEGRAVEYYKEAAEQGHEHAIKTLKSRGLR